MCLETPPKFSAFFTYYNSNEVFDSKYIVSQSKYLESDFSILTIPKSPDAFTATDKHDDSEFSNLQNLNLS